MHDCVNNIHCFQEVLCSLHSTIRNLIQFGPHHCGVDRASIINTIL